MTAPESAPSAVRPVLVIVAVVLAGVAGAAAVITALGHRSASASASASAPSAAATPPTRVVLRPVAEPPALVPSAQHTDQALMVGLIDPAADGIWNSAGSIATAEGEETWAPASDEDWRRLESHALAIVRGADALATPARANGREGWDAPARQLRVAGSVALDAARRRDVTGLYAASEGLLDACQQCHARYWLPMETTP
jgi:hypothetical protein